MTDNDRNRLDAIGQRILARGLQSLQEAELERIRSDPKKHRDTTLMGERGLRYRYYRPFRKSNKREHQGKEVRYCYATTPNAAGYYLTWTELVIRSSNGAMKSARRVYIRGHERRKDAKESALKGAENHGR